MRCNSTRKRVQSFCIVLPPSMALPSGHVLDDNAAAPAQNHLTIHATTYVDKDVTSAIQARIQDDTLKIDSSRFVPDLTHRGRSHGGRAEDAVDIVRVHWPDAGPLPHDGHERHCGNFGRDAVQASARVVQNLRCRPYPRAYECLVDCRRYHMGASPGYRPGRRRKVPSTGAYSGLRRQ